VATEAKTKPTKEMVTDFLNKVPDAGRREDCFAVATMMEEITGEKPMMWGPSIVGFGTYRYKYASGREGDWPVAAFSPRKQDLTVYLGIDFEKKDELLGQLGKHKTGKSCLYIKRLSDIHIPTLKKLLKASVKDVKTHAKSSAKSVTN
jgi:hypothetical protein